MLISNGIDYDGPSYIAECQLGLHCLLKSRLLNAMSILRKLKDYPANKSGDVGLVIQKRVIALESVFLACILYTIVTFVFCNRQDRYHRGIWTWLLCDSSSRCHGFVCIL